MSISIIATILFYLLFFM